MQFPGSLPTAPMRPADSAFAPRLNRQQTRGDMYLPAMPDLLRAPAQSPAPLRYGQKELAGTKPGVVVRGQSADDNIPKATKPQASQGQQIKKLAMPLPEDLGLSRAPVSRDARSSERSAPWLEARSQLEKVGATSYRLEKLPGSGFRFVCAVPYPEATDRQHEFEATGQSEEEAVHQALQQMQQWRQTK